MKVTESIATVLLILGLVLLLSGVSQSSPETMTRMIEGQEVVLNNKYAYGLNMREFFAVLCFSGCTIAIIAGAGKKSVVMGGVDA
jgi:hypothetical protein